MAQAESISSTITLTGVVPEMRFVYLDQNGYVTKVVGNTANNISPRAIGPDNKEAPITDAIMRQYDYFMAQHNWQLDAGTSYNVNPVEINDQASSQLIQIDAQLQASGSSLQLQAGATPESGQTG